MHRLALLEQLAIESKTKILFWIYDGVSGLPDPNTGLTELETAQTPVLDAFARKSSCGVHEPCGPGITAGSGLGHLALFGYPTQGIDVPRGVLEVLGSQHAFLAGVPVEVPTLLPGDLAIRGNFARLVGQGPDAIIEDRRVNTMASETCAQLCQQLSEALHLPDDVQLWLCPGKEHRFCAVLRADDLSDRVTDADPLRSGQPQPKVEALDKQAHRSAVILNDIIAQARQWLRASDEADTILMRGVGHQPILKTMPALYKMRCAAFASYPMYRGIARLVGMDVIGNQQGSLMARFDSLEAALPDYDFFFFHLKETDSLAHRGDFAGKVAFFEQCEQHLSRVLKMGFDVVVLTGDHCTPSIFGEHSWHPIPVAMWSQYVFAGQATRFTERECLLGTLGRRPTRELLPLALAEARRLTKLGA